MHSHELDGVQSRTLFVLWTGNESMSVNRLQALWSIYNNAGCPVALVNANTLDEWVRPGHPLHAAYPYLSATHKADYMRCYLMHHHGGGYQDIKVTRTRWGPYFKMLEDSGKLALGYTELPNGVVKLDGALGEQLRQSYADLLGVCAFIFRKQSPLTAEWLKRTEAVLDAKLELLKLHPAVHPQDQAGVILPDGTKSSYPLRWLELLGEVLHPLLYEYRAELVHADIAPFFGAYR